MKTNYSLALVGKEVTLVPYRKHHVARYHEWMCSPELLEATASEALSLEEEYEMQQSWRDDEKKVTFILLRGGQNGVEGGDAVANNEGIRMLGDVNLFLNDYNDPCNAEIEIMVAESGQRRRGYAREALKLMMAFGMETLSLHRFYAKIGESNSASINLFKSLGFAQVNYVEAFKEYEFAFDCRRGDDSDELLKSINDTQASLLREDYFKLPSTLKEWEEEE